MMRLRPIALALSAALCAGAAEAEVQKFMNTCDGKLCPYYQIVLTPPDGWVIDRQASAKNKVQILVPKGKNFGTAPALIYVQVFYHRDKQQTLETFTEVSNARWRTEVKDARITALPAVARANGKPGFLRFGYENPSQQQQAYEIGAFGLDEDTDGNEFVLDVVMTGASKAALDNAEKDYIAFLKAH